jgi:shikimate dehydrogenase
MLVYQGAIGYKLWTGEDAPVDVMRAALEKENG